MEEIERPRKRKKKKFAARVVAIRSKIPISLIHQSAGASAFEDPVGIKRRKQGDTFRMNRLIAPHTRQFQGEPG